MYAYTENAQSVVRGFPSTLAVLDILDCRTFLIMPRRTNVSDTCVELLVELVRQNP